MLWMENKMWKSLMRRLARLFGRVQESTQPVLHEPAVKDPYEVSVDDQPVDDIELDSIDDTQPIELVEGDDENVAIPPGDWDLQVHDADIIDDPEVTITEDDPEKVSS